MISRIFKKLVSKNKDGQEDSEPRLPEGVRVYVIGDIHGRIDLLERLYAMMEADRKDRPIGHCVEVFLGDYIDRGPSSRQVLDWMVQGYSFCNKRITLRGNHELYLQDFLTDPGVIGSWGQYGGLETLHSYGLKFRMPMGEDQWAGIQKNLLEVLPSSHRGFLENCILSAGAGKYFFAHAGVNPHISLDDQVAEDLLWIREPFLSHDSALPKMIVHGHTPTEKPEVEVHRIGIDTGAYITGRLTCAVLEGNDVRFLST
ncbi:MAG: metallophosphoesterase family protein [Pseudomonadota bacterium]